MSGKTWYTLREMRERGVLILRKISEKRKLWLIKHCRKGTKRSARKSKSKHARASSARTAITQFNQKTRIDAPRVLSLLENREETLQFFEQAINKIKDCKKNGELYFNLHNVEEITIDAVMYITALVNSQKRARAFGISFSGNRPKGARARSLMSRSGFFDFVYSNDVRDIEQDDRNIRISSGKDVDGALASRICDFVCGSLVEDLVATKGLYKIIMELMTNTKQHAYNGYPASAGDSWYVFAEDVGGSVKIVFLDTGDGIPKTIRKTLGENLSAVIADVGWAVEKKDAGYIASALRGESRTETKEKHRGKGLPEICESVCNGHITGLSILSGLGMCRVMDTGEIIEENLSTPFYGTLFMWDVKNMQRVSKNECRN